VPENFHVQWWWSRTCPRYRGAKLRTSGMDRMRSAAHCTRISRTIAGGTCRLLANNFPASYLGVRQMRECPAGDCTRRAPRWSSLSASPARRRLAASTRTSGCAARPRSTRSCL
jgi:hypothetical protein